MVVGCVQAGPSLRLLKELHAALLMRPAPRTLTAVEAAVRATSAARWLEAVEVEKALSTSPQQREQREPPPAPPPKRKLKEEPLEGRQTKPKLQPLPLDLVGVRVVSPASGRGAGDAASPTVAWVPFSWAVFREDLKVKLRGRMHLRLLSDDDFDSHMKSLARWTPSMPAVGSSGEEAADAPGWAALGAILATHRRALPQLARASREVFTARQK
jgi:hypothetical protein